MPRMASVHENQFLSNGVCRGRWLELAGRVLDGHRLTEAEGLAVLRAGDRDAAGQLAPPRGLTLWEVGY